MNESDAQLRQIQQRREVVAAWRTTCATFRAADRTKGEAMRAFLEQHPGVSPGTLYKWAARADDPDSCALLDRRSIGHRRDAVRISPAAWERFKDLWLTPQRRSVKLCYQIVAVEAKRQGWTWPRLRTVYRRIARDLPPGTADYHRLGEREWERRWGPKLRRDYDQYRAGQVWVGDFHKADVFCCRSEADPKILRPLVCAFEDLRSRLIVARVVNREDQNAVLLTFRDVVERWGVPDECIIDNGKPYRSAGFSGGRPGRRIEDEEYVRSVLGALRVRVHFSIPFNPDSKPIERWFRTLEGQYGATFASYCGGDNSDPRFKAAFKLAKEHPEQCPTLAEYAEKLAGYIEAYHQTPHTGEGMKGLSPAQAFERFDPIAKVTAPEGVLDYVLMRPTRPVKVTRYGVRFNGVEYGQNDTRLFALQGQKVRLRVDPQDAGYVIVCELDGRPICKAFNNRMAMTGVTQDDVAEGMKAKARAKRLVRQVYEGGTRAAMRSVTDEAIRARLAAAKPLAATGTDDKVPRNIRPLRSDLAESVARLNRQADPPALPMPERHVSLEELNDMMDAEPPAPEIDTLDILQALDWDEE